MAKFVSKENLDYFYSKIKTPINFAQEEYNNSKNLLDINNYVDLGGYIGLDISQLVIGETYTFSSNKPIYWFKISDIGAGYNSVAKEGQHTTFTFTMARNSNIPAGKKQYLILSINSSDIYSPITSISQLSGYNLQIEKGSVATTYQSFNGGEFVQKGNKEQIFLQNEYNKSLNKVYISSSNLEATSQGITNTLNADGGINCVGTCASNYFNISKTTPCYIPAGTYALSVNKTLTQYSLFMRVAYSDGTTGQMAIWKNNKSNVLTFSKDVISYSFFAGEATSGSVINDTLYIQLQKGSVVSSYQPYNGEIVHKGDIKPVLLWENGSPNSALEEVIITTSQNYSNYEELIAVYKEYNGSEFIPRYIRFKIVANGKLTILGHTGNSAYNNILRRTIWLYNNTNQIYIYGGKVSESGTTDNNAIILLEFLGVPN